MFSDHFSARATQYAHYRPSYPAALFTYLAGIAPRVARRGTAARAAGRRPSVSPSSSRA